MSNKQGNRFSKKLQESLEEGPGVDSAERQPSGWDPYEVWRTRVKDPQENRLSLKPRPCIEG